MASPIAYAPAAHGTLAAAVAAAPAGSTIVIPAGEHPGALTVEKDLELRGAGPVETRLSRGGRSRPIAVVRGPCRVRVSGIGFQGGEASFGGALRVEGDARVTVEDCVFSGNRARKGGGAIYVAGGDVAIRAALFGRNAAPLGGAILVDLLGTVAFEDVVIEENEAASGGGIFAREEAVLRLRDTVVRRNGASRGASALEARGTASRAPAIHVVGGALAGKSPAVVLAAPPGARLRPALKARQALLPAALRSAEGFTDAGGNRFA